MRKTILIFVADERTLSHSMRKLITIERLSDKKAKFQVHY